MNFRDYILGDIEEKTAFLNTLPTNTVVRRKKFNSTIEEMKKAYNGHKDMVRNFINYKYDKLMPVKIEKNLEDKCKNLIVLKRLLTLGNPNTTYMERLGFDMVMYELMHYYDYSLLKVNDIIDHFIKKFNCAGIKVSLNDFRLSYYSYMYMSYYFNGIKNNMVYESVFWLNQKVIEYIMICFRLLMKKHAHKLDSYAKKQFKNKLVQFGYKDYEDVKLAYVKIKKEIELLNEEDEYDIINLCLEKTIDINSLVKGSPIRESDYDYFMIDKIDLNNEEVVSKFITGIKNLRFNFEEYNAYLVNTELIDYFKDKYKSKLGNKDKVSTNNLKNKDKEISELLKKITKDSVSIFNSNVTMAKLESLKNNDKLFKQEQLLDDLYKKYIEYNELYFDSKVENLLKENMSVADVFELYEAYPYYERRTLKKLFELTNEEEIDERVNKIKEFIYNPNRKIIDMIPIFISKNIPQQLMNAFRFENLNVTEDSFEESNLKVLFEKSQRILRGIKVDKFSLTPEEVAFLVNVKVMKDNEIL